MDRVTKILNLVLQGWKDIGREDGSEMTGEAWILCESAARRTGAMAVLAQEVLDEMIRGHDASTAECPTTAHSLATDGAPDRHVADREMAAALAKAMLTRLNPREERMLRLRHLGDDPMIYREAGRQMGVCAARARQIELKAMRKLMHPQSWSILEPVLPDACRGHIIAERRDAARRRHEIAMLRRARDDARSAATPVRIMVPSDPLPRRETAGNQARVMEAPIVRPARPALQIDDVAAWLVNTLRPSAWRRASMWLNSGGWGRHRVEGHAIADGRVTGAELYIHDRTLHATVMLEGIKITRTGASLPLAMGGDRIDDLTHGPMRAVVDHPVVGDRIVKSVTTSSGRTTVASSTMDAIAWSPAEARQVPHEAGWTASRLSQLHAELAPDVVARHHLAKMGEEDRLHEMETFASAGFGYNLTSGHMTYYRTASGLRAKGTLATNVVWRDGSLIIHDPASRLRAANAVPGQDFQKAYPHPAFEGCVVANVADHGFVRLTPRLATAA